MKNTTHTLAIIFAVFALTHTAEAQKFPRVIRDNPAHPEPDLLTPYQKKVLTVELGKLQQEVQAARRKASESDKLKATRDELQRAIDNNLPEADITKLKRKLSDDTEVLLYTEPGMQQKITRLIELGTLLRYDKPIEKEKRLTSPKRTVAAPPEVKERPVVKEQPLLPPDTQLIDDIEDTADETSEIPAVVAESPAEKAEATPDVKKKADEPAPVTEIEEIVEEVATEEEEEVVIHEFPIPGTDAPGTEETAPPAPLIVPIPEIDEDVETTPVSPSLEIDELPLEIVEIDAEEENVEEPALPLEIAEIDAKEEIELPIEIVEIDAPEEIVFIDDAEDVGATPVSPSAEIDEDEAPLIPPEIVLIVNDDDTPDVLPEPEEEETIELPPEIAVDNIFTAEDVEATPVSPEPAPELPEPAPVENIEEIVIVDPVEDVVPVDPVEEIVIVEEPVEEVVVAESVEEIVIDEEPVEEVIVEEPAPTPPPPAPTTKKRTSKELLDDIFGD